MVFARTVIESSFWPPKRRWEATSHDVASGWGWISRKSRSFPPNPRRRCRAGLASVRRRLVPCCIAASLARLLRKPCGSRLGGRRRCFTGADPLHLFLHQRVVFLGLALPVGSELEGFNRGDIGDLVRIEAQQFSGGSQFFQNVLSGRRVEHFRYFGLQPLVKRFRFMLLTDLLKLRLLGSGFLGIRCADSRWAVMF
jgi:hypothetical protein